MTIRPLTRWLLAPLACLLVIAPTIAGLAHEQAHHAVASHHSQSSADHEHDSDHDQALPRNGSTSSVSGDHADPGHQAARIGSGLSTRIDLALAEAAPIGELPGSVVARSPIAWGPLDRRPDQTHHPPSFPRGPPSL